MVPQLERSLQLQDEIIQAYQQKAPELRRFAQKIKAGGSVAALQAAEEREAFLLELQKPLVARYGFEESAKGVRDAMVEYADIAENNLVTKRHNHMERLLAGGEDIDLYLGVPAQQAIRNFGTRRPAPPSQFPLVAREDFEKSFEGRRLPVPRKDMLAANTTEELAAACKRGDTLRAEALLGQSGVVNIGFHGLGPAGAKTLAQVISPKLEALELDITGNGIGPEGVKALASKIPKNLKVLSLGFSGMKMGAAGAAALAEAIPPQVKDLSLDLFGNKIGDDGMDLISKALPKSLELLHVVLQQNDLSRRGFFMLDRQIGDPLNQRFLPKLKPENFIKSGEVDVTEFKEEADGTIHRQVEWQRVI
ncbi:unnamed protein product [Durusdinium trenchii]|uniref:Protein C10 n=1 Tax=Durusdinium trenchii TaxID=1381693 RepID=A0ABP0I8Z5_9DINO